MAESIKEERPQSCRQMTRLRYRLALASLLFACAWAVLHELLVQVGP